MRFIDHELQEIKTVKPDSEFQEQEAEISSDEEVKVPMIVTQNSGTNGIYEIAVNGCVSERDFVNFLLSIDFHSNENIFLITFVLASRILNLEST